MHGGPFGRNSPLANQTSDRVKAPREHRSRPIFSSEQSGARAGFQAGRIVVVRLLWIGTLFSLLQPLPTRKYRTHREPGRDDRRHRASHGHALAALLGGGSATAPVRDRAYSASSPWGPASDTRCSLGRQASTVTWPQPPFSPSSRPRSRRWAYPRLWPVWMRRQNVNTAAFESWALWVSP